MRTARSLPYGGGGFYPGVSLTGTPWTETPWTDPLSRDPQKEHVTRDRDLLEETWDQADRQEVTSYRDLPCQGENDKHV